MSLKLVIENYLEELIAHLPRSLLISSEKIKEILVHVEKRAEKGR